MILESIVDFMPNDSFWEPSHVRGLVHSKVCFTVHAVSNFKAQAQNPKSNLWYTIKPDVRGSSHSKAKTIGKLTSKAIACGDGLFDTEHEMLVDTDMVHCLVLTVKTTSAILRRKVTIGKYTLRVSKRSYSSVDEVVDLKNKFGEAVGNVRISVTIAPTALPAVHCAPQPFWKPSPFVLTRPYTSLQREVSQKELGDIRDCQLVSFFQGPAGRIKVEGNDQRYIAKQYGTNWKISERSCPSFSSRSSHNRKFWLESTPAPTKGGDGKSTSHPMQFVLQDNSESSTAASSSLALIPGNAADPFQKEAPWGTWTLVRQFAASEETKEPRKDEFLALIHLAGPVVETWAAADVTLALAIANAMFWSCMLDGQSQMELHQKINTVSSRRCASSSWGWGSCSGNFAHGPGFFVLGEDAGEKGELLTGAGVTELRAKMSGVGANLQIEERSVAAFLRQSNKECEESLMISGLMVASQLDWGGHTLLGIPLF